MISAPLILSLSYFIVFMLFSCMGLYTLYTNPKARVNQLFFLVYLAIAIWSFSFSIMAHARSYTEAFYWARIASVGWCSLYAFLLHATIHHTHSDRQKIPSVYFLALYILPALLSWLFFFGPDSNFNPVLTPYGYVEAGVNIFDKFNLLVFVFNLYYLSYMVMIILLNYRSAKKSGTRQMQMRSYLILSSYLLTILLNTTTDFFYHKFDTVFPRLSVFFALIPMTAIFLSIKHFDFLQREEKPSFNPNQILNHQMKLRLYRNLGIIFIMTSFFNFVTRFHLSNQPISLEIGFSGLVMLFGILLGVTQRLPMSEQTKDLLTTVIIVLSIPLVDFHFSQFSSISVWAFPLFLFLFSTLFDKKWMIIVVGITAIVSESVSTFISHNVYIFVDSSDYLIRILFFIVMMVNALYVRRSFHQRLLENENQMNFQTSISLISQQLIATDIDNPDERIQYLLQIIGEYCQSDRSYIFLFSDDRSTMDYSYEWYNKEAFPTVDGLDSLPCSEFPWWVNKILHDPFLYISDISALPSEAVHEKEFLQSENLHSLICVPISKGDEVIGFMGLGFLKDSLPWVEERQSILEILSSFLSDFFEKKQVEKNLYTMAYFDSLTDLPNRLSLNDRLDLFISSRTEDQSPIGVLFLDLDNFKNVNETMGYSFGDLVLREFTKILSSLLSTDDVLARFSGDEFVILLPSPQNINAIEETAKKIMNRFRSPLIINKIELPIEFSMGIAIYPIDGMDTPTLIKNADITMYESKRLGKNQYLFCSAPIQDQINEKIYLTNHLHHAIAQDELQLYYQPQVNTKTGQIIGFEALLRWFHPTLGAISPGVFIPIAEQTGLIHSIGKWVLLTACKQIQQWNEQYQCSHQIAVNLSTKQFNDPHLIHTVQDVLEQSGLSPNFLELEITESEEFETETHILGMLHQLKSLDLNISIDDFGTKYSSLGRLKALPLDKIKIDMEFIRGITTSQKDRGITKSIIDLSKSLGLSVIAEGVETQEQLDFLLENQCDEIQGYYFYRPMSPVDIEALLQEQATHRLH